MRNNKYALHSLVTCVFMIVMSVILTIAIIECTTFSYAIESVDEDTIKQDENSKIIKPKSSVIANAEEDESGTLIINEHSLEVFVNSTKTLQTTFHSEDENDYILWSSSNEEIATVNQNGTVKAVGSGSCIIRAESKLFGFYDECEVKVDSSMSKCKITIPYKEKIYSGRSYKPTVTIKDPQGRKIQKSSYSVQYLNNKEIGKATVTVTGKAPYKGTIKKTFIIKPKKGVIKKISADYKKASLKIKNAGGDVYYQIKYRKSGKNWHYKKIGKKVDKTVTKLANRKYYYFSVRPYKKVNGVTYYGKWSRTKKVQIGISIKKCKIKGVVDKVYTGKRIKQNIKIYYKGKRVKGRVVYGKNRKNVGTRYVTIYGTGKFIGKIKKSYYIWPKSKKLSLDHDAFNLYEDDEYGEYDVRTPRYSTFDVDHKSYIRIRYNIRPRPIYTYEDESFINDGAYLNKGKVVIKLLRFWDGKVIDKYTIKTKGYEPYESIKGWFYFNKRVKPGCYELRVSGTGSIKFNDDDYDSGHDYCTASYRVSHRIEGYKEFAKRAHIKKKVSQKGGEWVKIGKFGAGLPHFKRLSSSNNRVVPKNVWWIKNNGSIYVWARAKGKATVTLTLKNGKRYKTRVDVQPGYPNFMAYLQEYNTRGNYFVVKVKNLGVSKLIINRKGAKVTDKDYKSYDRRIKASRPIVISKGQTKRVRFYVNGSTTWYDVDDFTMHASFKYEGKTYKWKTRNNYSWYKRNHKWRDTFWDFDIYDEWA